MPEEQTAETPKPKTKPVARMFHLPSEVSPEREQQLRSAKPMEEILKECLSSRSIPVPENTNLTLLGVEEFIDYAKIRATCKKGVQFLGSKIVPEREAISQLETKENELAASISALRNIDTERDEKRKLVDEKSKTSAEKGQKVKDYYQMTREYALLVQKQTEMVRKMKEYLDCGDSFEFAFREYQKERMRYFEFKKLLYEEKSLEEQLRHSSFSQLSPQGHRLTQKDRTLLEDQTKRQSGGVLPEEDILIMMDTLKENFPEGSAEYERNMDILNQLGNIELPDSEKTARERLATVRERINDLWETPMVRYFWKMNERQQLRKAFAEGENVLEDQRTIGYMIQLAEWEKVHQKTTIGGVLVGPPGVGKTTLIQRYLEKTGRNHVYIDLSEDVTRYLLFGSKSIEFKDPTEVYKNLIENLEKMDDQAIVEFIKQNSQRLDDVFSVGEDEAVGLCIEMISGLTSTDDLSGDKKQKLAEVKRKILAVAKTAFIKELGNSFYQTVHQNGWRYGVAVHALRNNQCVIFDEFNKFKDWSLLHGLMTAEPRKPWYFADNNEWINVPENWRMYFTANVGRRYGGFKVSEAVSSRAEGKIMEIGYPSMSEELQMAFIFFDDQEGYFLRPEQDLLKLCILIRDVFPKIRTVVEEKPGTIPISYRTLRNLAEKLILTRDPKTKEPVYRPTETSFDKALYDILIESYALYEDKTIPKTIVEYCTAAGLFLTNDLKDKVVGIVGETKWDELKKAQSDQEKDYKKMIEAMLGINSRQNMMAQSPRPSIL